MAAISCLMSFGIILLKRPYISISLLLGVWNVKTTYRKSWPGNLFQLLTVIFDPFFSVKWDHLTTKALYLLPYYPIFNHSCHSAAVPIVPGVVTQIINTLLFLLSAHQSSSQSNILITALPLMLLRSGMNSLMMCTVQHQLPPSERS